jgi:lysophospholipase L1-like esterase
MKSNLPITFADKINSQEILAIMSKLPASSFFSAEDINLFKKAINELYDLYKANPLFKSDIDLTSDAPTISGIYIPSVSGVYSKWLDKNGNPITINVGSGLSIISYNGVYSTLIFSPIDFSGYAKKTDVTSKADIIVGKNKFNKATIVSGFYMGENGVVNANSTLWHSDFISVVPGKQYSSSVRLRFFTYFNSNKVVVAGGGSYSYGFTVPVGVAFVVFSCEPLSSADNQQFEIGSVSTAFEPYALTVPLSQLDLSTVVKKTDIVNSFSSTSTSLPPSANTVRVLKEVLDFKVDLKLGKNLFNKNSSGILEVTYIGAGGAFITNQSYFVSDFIPIGSLKEFIHSGFDMGGANSAFYDSNKSYISTFNSASPLPLTTPLNCAYVRMSGTNVNKNIQQFELGSVVTPYEAYKLRIDPEALVIPTLSFIDDGNITSAVNGKAVSDALKNKSNIEVGKNLFNPNDKDILVDRWISSTGVYSNGDAQYGLRVSGFIPIAEGQSLKGNNFISNLYVALYSANKTYIVGSAVNSNLISWLPGASFARFSFYKTEINTLQIEYGKTSTSYLAYTEKGFLENYSLKTDALSVCVLPKKMYFVKNKQLSIYFENVIFKNMNEGVGIYFDKGINYNRQVVFNFSLAEKNNVFKTLLSKNLNKGEEKSFNYDVIDGVVNSGKTVNVLCVGDSFTDIGQWVKETKNLLNTDGVIVNLLGTCGNSTFKAEGLSGGRLLNTFLDTSSGRARVVSVVGMTVIPSTGYPGVNYLDSVGNTWTIRGGKITNGSGKIVVTRFGATVSDFSTFPSSGTLTKVSADSGKEGDQIINYNSAIEAYFNPFINPSSGLFDLKNYISFWDFAAPNIVVFQFTWNDIGLWASESQINTLVGQYKTAIDHVKLAYPGAKVVISIEPFGSVNGNKDWNGKKYTVLKLMPSLLFQFEDNIEYNTWVKVAPSYACVDLVNGYSNASSVTPSTRYSVTEVSGGDGVHPSTAGMNQIADCVYPVLSHLLTL